MPDRRPRLRRACLPLLAAFLCIACASSAASTKSARSSEARATAPAAPATVVSAAAAPATVVSAAASPARPAAARPAAAKPASPAKPAPRLPLAGKIVGIDPGHNGRNYADPSFIDHLIWNGREQEACDTTGTSTDGGYTEARFNFNVARYLTRDLRAEGARVVLTRTSNDGVGPCVTTRAQILDRTHANVAIDIHADGGPPGGRGFAILEPVADGPNNRVIGSSRRFGADLRSIYRSVAGMPLSTYDGVDGIAYRDDLAGLNLTTVPKVLIECGNMRNATDAALLVRASFQQRAAQAFARSIMLFLTGRP
jgi:N-acetylmuramoyl-L-alanine amidase